MASFIRLNLLMVIDREWMPSFFDSPAKRLRAIPRDYLGFLVASGHCCNELAILLPYIIYEHDLS